MDALTPLLSTEDLTRHYGGIRAVDGVNFTLNAGEIRAIIGPNGAGKTTFVSLLSGRTAPSGGRISFAGQDVTALPAFRRVELGIAYTFQITNVYKSMSVADNVRIAVQSRLKRHVGAPLDPEAETVAALEAVDLAARADTPASQLAYGHQRLLEIAMGVALQPKLLILDEPTQGLSDSEIENFLLLVRRIGKSATILLIEHNMHVVMSLADRISVLTRGRLLAEGTPDEIRNNADVQAAYLGS